MSDKEGKKMPGRAFWIILVVVVLFVMAGTAAAVYFFLAPNMAQTRELPTYQVPLDTFTVNLKDSNYRRYLRTNITVETSDKKVIKELAEKQYKIKDTINSVLAAKNATDLEDRESLKEQLITAINSHLTEGEVVGLYFEEFMIQ